LRLIHHLSWPRVRPDVQSVNSNIEILDCPLSSFDDAIKMLNEMGDLSDVWLFKVDIKSAYRCIPVRPADWCLLGGRWNGKLYFDMSLPFGMRSSCACWECYSSAAEWIARRVCHLQSRLIHYIDDYLGVVQGKPEAERKLQSMLKLFDLLGIPVSPEKVEGPLQQLVFLGIEIDVVERQIRLDQSKLKQYCLLLDEWDNKQRCTRQELQSLLGCLHWTTTVVRGGRTFLRHVIEAIRSRPHHFALPVELTIRADLYWWRKFLHAFNGVSIIPESKWTESWSDQCQLFTDASKHGYGARWGRHYLHGQWTQSQLIRARGDEIIIISVLELAAIAIAVMSWSAQWEGKRITIRSDNTGAVAAITTGSCRQPLMMDIVRELWFTCCTHSCEIRSVHVAGVVNVDADDLSRGEIDKFLQRNPTVNSSPTIPLLPQCLL